MAINIFEWKKATDSDISEGSDVSDKKTAEIAGVDINHGRASRLGWLVLAIGFGGFLLWAALAPLDQGVPAGGQVVVTGNRKTVQNLGPEWSRPSWSRTAMRSTAAMCSCDWTQPRPVRSSKWPAVSGSWSRQPRRGCWPTPRGVRKSSFPKSC
jgi:hypothetical protein